MHGVAQTCTLPSIPDREAKRACESTVHADGHSRGGYTSRRNAIIAHEHTDYYADHNHQELHLRLIQSQAVDISSTVNNNNHPYSTNHSRPNKIKLLMAHRKCVSAEKRKSTLPSNTMCLSTAPVVLALNLHALTFATSLPPHRLQPKPNSLSERATQHDQGELTLTTDFTGHHTVATPPVPWGIVCYTPELSGKRRLITYDTCLPLLDVLTTEQDFRIPKAYSSRNPKIWKTSNQCQFTAWPGPGTDFVSDQVVAAMAVW